MHIKVIASALINGLIAGLGALMAVVTGLDSGAQISQISDITWLVIGVTGILTAAKDAQSYLKNTTKKGN